MRLIRPSSPPRPLVTPYSSVRVALTLGSLLLVAALLATLSRSPAVVAGSNSVAGDTHVATTRGNAVICQSHEVVPSGTVAVRLWVNTNVNPPTRVVLRSGSRVISEGAQGPGRLTSVIAIPIRRVRHELADATVCFVFGRAVEPVRLIGGPLSGSTSGRAFFKIRLEYMHAGDRTWWSRALSVARHIGLGRAPAGTWVAALPLTAMAVVALLVAWQIIRQLGAAYAPETSGRGRAPGLICALIACLSAFSWSVLTPPFQAPDEPSHFAYVQQLAETRSLPSSGDSTFSEEEEVALADLHEAQVQFSPTIGTISTVAEERQLDSDLARPLTRRDEGDAGVAASEPPLYYLLQTIPYALGSGGTLLDQLALMRLLSVLMAGATALFTFLFLREAAPRAPWAWTVGALATALEPLVGFISGSINPDSMLCAVSAALFYCLARAFRHGLTRGRAIAIGAVLAVGFLTKLNFLGLAPGAALALVILGRRAARQDRSAAYVSLALAVAVATSPALVYIGVNLLSGRPALGLLSKALPEAGKRGSILSELVYIWQLYLPRLPGMRTDFVGIMPWRQLWFDRAVGAYGWLDTYFPNWVYELALIPAAAIGVLLIRSLALARRSLRSRAGELCSYAVIGVGVLALVGADSYLKFPAAAGSYAEPRYLLPMAALFAAALALAARGAGRRFGPAAGTVIVLLVLAQDLFSQLLVVGRYYG
jgi:predicted membrane protein DUF2142